jgi:hypothetical protein
MCREVWLPEDGEPDPTTRVSKRSLSALVAAIRKKSVAGLDVGRFIEGGWNLKDEVILVRG